MGFYDQRIEFRGTKEIKMYLMTMENHSDYIRGLIEKDRFEQRDPTFLNQRIKDYEQKIKDIRVLKKTKRVDSEHVKEILQFGYETYLKDRTELKDNYNISWIKARVISALKDRGCTYYKAEEILEDWKKRR